MHAGDSQDLRILASHETSGLDGLPTVLALLRYVSAADLLWYHMYGQQVIVHLHPVSIPT